MIFVTVGTHEDQFNRLIKEVDRLIETGIIEEEVFMQIGYSDYTPTYSRYNNLLAYQDMDKMMKTARIVITHGGPGSIMHSLRYGKVPIVVPRQSVFGEHVDNHQVFFSKRLEQIGKVITVLDMDDLQRVISNYGKLIEDNNAQQNTSNNLDSFVTELDKIAKRLLKL